jgi:ribosome biogenesis GTPase / thiamine phosphate phosphatase
MSDRETKLLEGLIVRSQSGFFTVETDQGSLVCQLRGRLKKGPRLGDIAAVGDRVQVSSHSPGQGMIEALLPRKHMLARLDPTPRGVYQQIIVANPDQAVFVFSCFNPEPRLGMLDRFLVIAEKQALPSLIVANKIDLVSQERAQELFGCYEQIGYPVLYTSARSQTGLEALRKCLSGKLSALAGPSGVGKSSLLNALQEGLGLAVREISQATSKGRHTTVVRQLFPLAEGGYIVDTPGLKALALWDIEPHEIDGYFPELRKLVDACQFNDCTHTHEPSCAVREALGRGQIHPGRYESYVRMRQGQEEN